MTYYYYYSLDRSGDLGDQAQAALVPGALRRVRLLPVLELVLSGRGHGRQFGKDCASERWSFISQGNG
jgi:hypothetical protein